MKQLLSRLRLFILGIALSSGILSSCSSSKQASAPKPQERFVSAVEQVKENSLFRIPIEISIPELERKLNLELGNVLYYDSSLTNNNNDNLILIAKKFAPVQLEGKTDYIQYIVPLSIYLKAGYSVQVFGQTIGKYEDTRFRVNLKFATKVNVSSTYQVSTQTTPLGFDWVDKPIVQLGGFQIPITSLVNKVLDYALVEASKQIDEEVKKKVAIKEMVQKTWDQVQNPIQVNRDYNVWLRIQPTQLELAPLTTKNGNLRTVLGMAALTETRIGQDLSNVKFNKTPLPNLVQIPGDDERIAIGLINTIDYNTLTRMAQAQAVGKTFKDGKKEVKVDSLDIYPQGDKLVTLVKLSGSFNGKVYLKGQPGFDAKMEKLVLKNPDFDLETSNFLAKTANWLAHGTFVKMMQPYLEYDLKNQLTQAKDQINKALNKNNQYPNLEIDGALNHLSPDNIYLTKEGIQTVVKAEGKVLVRIKGL